MVTGTVFTYIPAPEFFALHRGRLGWIGSKAYYQALNSGEIPSIRLGKNFLVRADAIEVMAERVEKQQS